MFESLGAYAHPHSLAFLLSNKSCTSSATNGFPSMLRPTVSLWVVRGGVEGGELILADVLRKLYLP